MDKNNWDKIKCYLKKEWHRVIAKGMVGIIVVAGIWTISKTADIIVFANELPDTLDTIVKNDAHQNIKIAEHDSLLREFKAAFVIDSTAQRQILNGIEDLKNLLGKKVD